MTPALSVLVLTWNSEETLAGVLESVSFADEILIIDSGSTDRTLEIAGAARARVLQRPLDGYAEQRNLGWREACGRWILALDCDEVLDPITARAIRDVVSRDWKPSEPVGYEILWRNYFLGHALLHGGLDKDFHVRLALRERSHWEGAIHERLVIEGPLGRLPGVVHHYTARDLASRLRKVGAYAEARSAEMRAAGVRFSAARALWQPLRFFAGRLVVRGGYRDGIHGVAWWWLLSTEILLAHLLLASERGRVGSVPRTNSGRGEQPPE